MLRGDIANGLSGASPAYRLKRDGFPKRSKSGRHHLIFRGREE